MADIRANNYGRKTIQTKQTNAISAAEAATPPFPLSSNQVPRRNRFRGKRQLNLATWNVRTMQDRGTDEQPERRSALIAMELARYRIDVAALSETRLADQGKLCERGVGYTFYWIGHPASSVREHGVGFAVANHLISRLVGEPVGISPRIISMRLHLGGRRFATLFSVYAPPLNHTDSNKDIFYDQLSSALRATPNADRLIVMGDFNARVGAASSLWPNVLGPYGTGKSNGNGERLLSFCSTFGLAITNTLFRLDQRDIVTWTHPRSGHRHLLDYILVRQRDRGDVRITRAMRGADCGSDHILVRTKLALNLTRSAYCDKRSRRPVFNIRKLDDSKIRSEFCKAVDSRLTSVDPTGSPEIMWAQIKSGLSSAAVEILGYSKKTKPDWFNENSSTITDLVKLKNQAHAMLQEDPMNSQSELLFKQARNNLNKQLREIKDEWWRTQSEMTQLYADRRQYKEFYASLKTVFGPSVQSLDVLIEPLSGNVQTSGAGIRSVWCDHFYKLFNRSSSINWTAVDRVPQRPIKPMLDRTPDLPELEGALRQLCNGKTAGADGLPAEIFKCGGLQLAHHMLNLVRSIWTHEAVPQEFKDALLIPLYKGKGSKRVTDNYRGISLLSCAGKLVARILLNRLNAEVLHSNVPEEQCGFRAGRSTTDLIFAFRQIQEKCREHNQPLWAMFVDISKAFDSVNRDVLWAVLGKFGCPGKFVNLIKCFHNGMQGRVQSCGSASPDFTIGAGVKQGCVLAPSLFSLYLTAVLSVAFDDSDPSVNFEYRFDGRLLNSRRLCAKTRLSSVSVRMLLFADDCALFANTREELQQLASSFATAAHQFGLSINAKKSFVFHQPSSTLDVDLPTPLLVDGNPVSCCSDFCYLGSNVSTNLSFDHELKSRVSKAAAAFGRLERRVWQDHQLRMGTKIMVYKAMVLSTLLYGSETWALYRHNIRYLERFHLSCLRRILGVRWSDMIPNTEILRRAGVQGIEAMVMLHQLRWAGHVCRMDSTRIPRQLLYGRLKAGKRRVGRPTFRYVDSLKRSLLACDLNMCSWESSTRDRSCWRKSIRSGVKLYHERSLSQRERKRAIRKGLLGAVGRTEAVTWHCDECGRACVGRRGLVSHQRSHSELPAKRRRVC